MPFCTNCGAQIAEGAKFCTNCGAPISRASEKLFMTEMYISAQTVEKSSPPLLRFVPPADMR